MARGDDAPACIITGTLTLFNFSDDCFLRCKQADSVLNGANQKA